MVSADEFNAMVGRCYYCPLQYGNPPATYVRWHGTRHYAFLCDEHRTEYGEHVATEYDLEEAIARLRTQFVDGEKPPSWKRRKRVAA